MARFSALQRAENSSIYQAFRIAPVRDRFQCSSASRKFLNPATPAPGGARGAFQCSSASRKFLNRSTRYSRCRASYVSVLFSEPKIPQLLVIVDEAAFVKSFSALQRAENSSIDGNDRRARGLYAFQCSSASRKFLNQYVYYPKQQDFKFQCSSASRKFLNHQWK